MPKGVYPRTPMYTQPCLYCGEKVWALGLCRKHWGRWYRKIPMDEPPPPQGWIDKKGYRWVCAEGNREVFEHRTVAEKKIGRALLPTEDVHHKNGIKSDNGEDNLEVIDHALHTSRHRAHRSPCKICGIDSPHQARGLCPKHYMQARRSGEICV